MLHGRVGWEFGGNNRQLDRHLGDPARAASDVPDKLSTHRFRQRPRDRSLSNSGRTVQEQNRSLVGRRRGLLRSRSRHGRRRHRRIAENEGSFGRGFGRGRDWSSRRRRRWCESGLVRGQGEIGLPLLLLQSQNRQPFEQALLDLVCARLPPQGHQSRLSASETGSAKERERSARAPSP